MAPLWQGHIDSNLSMLCQFQSILYAHTKISNRILNLGMSEQDLDCAKVACRLIDHSCLRSPERVCAILFTSQANRSHQFIDQPGILARAKMIGVINPAGKTKSSIVPPLRSSHASKLALTSDVISNLTGRPVFC